MTRILITFLVFSILSCSSKQVVQEDSEQIDNTKSFHPRFYGKWINSALFDSTLKYKSLEPWLGDFYRNVLLTIDERDTINLRGNMDNLPNLPIKVIDSLTIIFDRPRIPDSLIYRYLPNKDLIEFKDQFSRVLFRRVLESDKQEIIGSRKKFNSFFIEHFFTDDFFIGSKKPEFTYIWNGFETHTPYYFDAVRIP